MRYIIAPYDFNREASFMTALIGQSNIILHPGIDIPSLAKTYRGQFPAMLRKMMISYNTIFPDSWTEKWLMERYSAWLIKPVDLPPTPHNAATSQASAPVVKPPSTDNQRMYPPTFRFLMLTWMIVLGDFNSYTPVPSATRIVPPVSNVVDTHMIPAWPPLIPVLTSPYRHQLSIGPSSCCSPHCCPNQLRSSQPLP